jgi:iron complex transport system permease protein
MKRDKLSLFSVRKKTTNSQVFNKKVSDTGFSKFLNPGSLHMVNEWFKNKSNAVVGIFMQRLFIIGSLVVLIILMLASMSLGRYHIPITGILKYLFTGNSGDSNYPIILLNIRLPRIIGAVVVGGALSIAGASYQGMFRNPMVSPNILGVTSGAGFGASLAILLSFSVGFIQVMSFIGGIGAVLIAVSISKWIGKNHDRILVLVLSGIVISSLFSSMLSILKYVADPDDKLPAITYWLMGSLASIRMSDLTMVTPIILIGAVPLILVSWRINVLSFGEDEARSLGLNTVKLRALIIVCASLVTACTISVSGIIGWVGLIIPHLTRMMVGPNHKILLPASFILGGIFMLVVDNIARALASIEIPLGILTSVIGAPLFIYFLKKSTKKTW